MLSFKNLRFPLNEYCFKMSEPYIFIELLNAKLGLAGRYALVRAVEDDAR
jgi:hypothetical protein